MGVAEIGESELHFFSDLVGFLPRSEAPVAAMCPFLHLLATHLLLRPGLRIPVSRQVYVQGVMHNELHIAWWDALLATHDIAASCSSYSRRGSLERDGSGGCLRSYLKDIRNQVQAQAPEQ